MRESIKRLLDKMVFIERGEFKHFELGEFIDLMVHQIPFNRFKEISGDFKSWKLNSLKLADYATAADLLTFQYHKKVSFTKKDFDDREILFPINIILQLIDFLYVYQKRKRSLPAKLNLTFEQQGHYALCDIATHVRPTEHWFHPKSQNELLDMIHQLTSSLNLHSPFVQIERIIREDKTLIRVRFDLQMYDDEEKETIGSLIKDMDISGIQYLSKNINHVSYGYSDGRFFKIFDSRILLHKKNTLFSEYIFLNRLKGLNGFPRVEEYRKVGHYEILVLENIKGQNLDEYLSTNKTIDKKLLFKLFDQLRKLRLNYIAHRDLKSPNIIITSDEEIYIFDFDQAIFDMDLKSKLDIDRSRYSPNSPPYTLNKTLARHEAVKQQIQEIQDRLNKVWSEAAKSHSSSPGRDIAYYSYDFGELELPGERDFFERFILFEKNDISFKNKNVVELGSNLGLFGAYCALYGAENVVCYDIDEKIVECAREFADIIGIRNIKHEVRDLNIKGSFADISQIDILFSLSVLYWLSDTTEFERLMRLADEVIYEGHEQYDVEIERLQSWNYAHIKPLGMTSRFRTLFYATK